MLEGGRNLPLAGFRVRTTPRARVRDTDRNQSLTGERKESIASERLGGSFLHDVSIKSLLPELACTTQEQARSFVNNW
jgi:hypothetical protein